jgi:hypothetical protein
MQRSANMISFAIENISRSDRTPDGLIGLSSRPRPHFTLGERHD